METLLSVALSPKMHPLDWFDSLNAAWFLHSSDKKALRSTIGRQQGPNASRNIQLIWTFASCPPLFYLFHLSLILPRALPRSVPPMHFREDCLVNLFKGGHSQRATSFPSATNMQLLPKVGSPAHQVLENGVFCRKCYPLREHWHYGPFMTIYWYSRTLAGLKKHQRLKSI